MKKIILSIFLLFIVAGAFAQRQKINYLSTFDDKTLHFGFTLGINTLDFAVVNYNTMGDNPNFEQKYWPLDKKQIGNTYPVRSDVAELVPGFTVGIISSLRLSRDFDLRFLPGLSFGERKMAYNIDVWDVYSDQPSNYYSLKSTFLDFPLLIKYKARRINNNRPYNIWNSLPSGYFQNCTGRSTCSQERKLLCGIGCGLGSLLSIFQVFCGSKIKFGLK